MGTDAFARDGTVTEDFGLSNTGKMMDMPVEFDDVMLGSTERERISFRFFGWWVGFKMA